jgi:hypothetical protein
MTDLAERIDELSDEDAIGALELVVRHQNPGSGDITLRAGEQQRRFRQALADPGARRELEARASVTRAPADGDDLSRGGDLARAMLRYLAEQGVKQRDDVAHALGRPAPVGERDPVTLAIVGFVVLALRPKIDVEHDQLEGWKFSFKTEPLKDSAMAKVLGKLLSAIFPGSADR